MSDLNYYAVPPDVSRVPHRGGLIAWGVVLIVLGGVYGLSVVASLGLAAVAAAGGRGGIPAGTMAAGGSIAAVVAGGLLTLGIGCCKGRRWCRPLVIAAATVTGGTLVLSSPVTAMTLAATSSAAAAGPSPLPPQVMRGIVIGSAVLMLAAVVGVSAAMVAWFRRPSVADTLARLDPVSRWTDDVPIAVVTWGVACLFMGLGMVAAAPGGLWFLFTRALVGPPAMVAAAAFGLGLIVAAVGSLRRSVAAWAAGVALVTVLTASSVTFALAGDRATYDQVMDDRVRQARAAFTPAAAAASRPAVAPVTMAGAKPVLSAAVYCGGLVCLGLYVRRRVAGPVGRG